MSSSRLAVAYSGVARAQLAASFPSPPAPLPVLHEGQPHSIVILVDILTLAGHRLTTAALTEPHSLSH
jgi:hypothetical protein